MENYYCKFSLYSFRALDNMVLISGNNALIITIG
jgi:hypothetical protein